jgi:hypothetical protein
MQIFIAATALRPKCKSDQGFSKEVQLCLGSEFEVSTSENEENQEVEPEEQEERPSRLGI